MRTLILLAILCIVAYCDDTACEDKKDWVCQQYEELCKLPKKCRDNDDEDDDDLGKKLENLLEKVGYDEEITPSESETDTEAAKVETSSDLRAKMCAFMKDAKVAAVDMVDPRVVADMCGHSSQRHQQLTAGADEEKKEDDGKTLKRRKRSDYGYGGGHGHGYGHGGGYGHHHGGYGDYHGSHEYDVTGKGYGHKHGHHDHNDNDYGKGSKSGYHDDSDEHEDGYDMKNGKGKGKGKGKGVHDDYNFGGRFHVGYHGHGHHGGYGKHHGGYGHGHGYGNKGYGGYDTGYGGGYGKGHDYGHDHGYSTYGDYYGSHFPTHGHGYGGYGKGHGHGYGTKNYGYGHSKGYGFPKFGYRKHHGGYRKHYHKKNKRSKKEVCNLHKAITQVFQSFCPSTCNKCGTTTTTTAPITEPATGECTQRPKELLRALHGTDWACAGLPLNEHFKHGAAVACVCNAGNQADMNAFIVANGAQHKRFNHNAAVDSSNALPSGRHTIGKGLDGLFNTNGQDELIQVECNADTDELTIKIANRFDAVDDFGTFKVSDNEILTCTALDSSNP